PSLLPSSPSARSGCIFRTHLPLSLVSPAPHSTPPLRRSTSLAAIPSRPLTCSSPSPGGSASPSNIRSLPFPYIHLTASRLLPSPHSPHAVRPPAAATGRSSYSQGPRSASSPPHTSSLLPTQLVWSPLLRSSPIAGAPQPLPSAPQS